MAVAPAADLQVETSDWPLPEIESSRGANGSVIIDWKMSCAEMNGLVAYDRLLRMTGETLMHTDLISERFNQKLSGSESL